MALRLMVFQHEWKNHGTCFNTLTPSCLPDGPEGAEAVAYFQRVVELFRKLPTYKWLESQGITPSRSRTHTLSELTRALKDASGVSYSLSNSVL
jgi:ribonuclease T2